ncbi:MAG: zinc-dependent metalloprotease, partial [Bacteroidales bacterium]|nr:zinc-dependent metalloprotease [Bacteroidales bacterium]
NDTINKIYNNSVYFVRNIDTLNFTLCNNDSFIFNYYKEVCSNNFNCRLDSFTITNINYFMKGNSISFPLTLNKEVSSEILVKFKIKNYVTGYKNNTLTFKDSLVFKINTITFPIVYFKPADENNYFKEFGFDNAQIKTYQNLGDYQVTKICNDSIYYVPWLRISPNNQAKLKLEFDKNFVSTLNQLSVKDQNVGFVLKTSNGISVNGKNSHKISLDSLSQNIIIRGQYECDGEVSVFSYIDDDEEFAGKIQVHCKSIETAGRIRFILIKKKGETSYPVINSQLLIDSINAYFVQAGIKFILDKATPEKYQINKIDNISSNLEILNACRNFYKTINQAENQRFDLFYIFISSVGADPSVNGSSFLPLNVDKCKTKQKWIVMMANSPTIICHEICHTMGLPHTFDFTTENNSNYNYKLLYLDKNHIMPKYSTKNIMDYSIPNYDRRKYLFKYQIEHLENFIKNNK